MPKAIKKVKKPPPDAKSVELRRTNNGSDIINKPKTDGIANVRNIL